RRWRSAIRNEDGTTAIELGMVAMPFTMMIVALSGIATYYFTSIALDRGIDTTSRLLRTGQAQQAEMTVEQFKAKVCENGNFSTGSWVDCSKMEVFVQKFPSWDSVAKQSCLKADGSRVTSTANSSDEISQYSGNDNEIVMITTCYKWEFPSKVPWFKLGQMGDGSMMMQSSTVMRTEPFPNTQP
ncbi:MAG: TadE/TadG family type IV pilus assembly protein, partial [Hyphomicrobium sp.]